jgi:hypothetical protein
MYYTTQVSKQLSRQFDDEVILANLGTGIYYSLSGTAADIWLGLQSGVPIKEVVTSFETLGAGRVEDIEGAITRFIDKLVAEGIIMPQEGTPDRRPWSPQFSDAFSHPVLERCDDLRDLIFLDPVHDVSEAGWPVEARNGV